jgi:hypothetical protein
MSLTPNSRWLPPKETAAYLHVSEDCLQAWRSARKGPPWSKVGKVVRYDVYDLDNFLKRHTQQPLGSDAAA